MTKLGPLATSAYVIDGLAQDLTPAQLLGAVTEGSPAAGKDPEGTIVDETVDPKFSGYEFDPQKTDEYLALVLNAERTAPMASAGTYTRERAASSLIDALWKKGHFKLDDLLLKASWRWNTSEIGSHAAFYESASSAAEYVDALGLKFSSTRCVRTSGASEVVFKPEIGGLKGDADFGLDEDNAAGKRTVLSSRRACPPTLVADPRSWVVYIPFDSSDYRLGGSLLAQALGLGGGACPEVCDADYFIDCYEVVREMVEDGVIISAATVGEGGLMTALSRIASGGVGVVANLSDIMRASQEKLVTRVLFSEVPGVIVQIRDSDFDYMDAELLLQDVAFYPLGHPTPDCPDVRVKASAKTGIQTILETLMQNAEGED